MSEDATSELVGEILKLARQEVALSINTAMLHSYWLIGEALVRGTPSKQIAASRSVFEDAAAPRQREGLAPSTLRLIRAFYLAFPEGSMIPENSEVRTTTAPLLLSSTRDAARTRFPPNLSWSHYLTLVKIPQLRARAFYELAAAKGAWSVAELERNVASLLFERTHPVSNRRGSSRKSGRRPA